MWKTWGKGHRGITGFQIEQSRQGQEYKWDQAWNRAGLSPGAPGLPFCVPVGCVLFFSSYTSSAWPYYLTFSLLPHQRVKDSILFLLILKIVKEADDQASWIICHLDNGCGPAWDHLRRWQFLVRASCVQVGEKGHTFQEGGCSAHQKQRNDKCPLQMPAPLL